MADEQVKRMDPSIKAKWVAALRSGEYTQGKRFLRGADKFCCLGVLCNLHAQAHPRIASRQKAADAYMGHMALPPKKVARWANLDIDSEVGIGGKECALYVHNDAGRTFAEIADAIESQL